MTRLDIEKSILGVMGLLDANGAIAEETTANQRRQVQGAIAKALKDLAYSGNWLYRSWTAGALLKAPAQGTASWTDTTGSMVISGGPVVANDWIGCHIFLGDGLPRTVIGVTVASNRLQVAEPPISAPASQGFTLFYDGLILPSACFSLLRRGGVQLLGIGELTMISMEDLRRLQGLAAPNLPLSYAEEVRRASLTPARGQPKSYNLEESVVINGQGFPLLRFWPMPNQAYPIMFRGHRTITDLPQDGTSGTAGADDAVVPDLPSEWHDCLLLPEAKLRMCEFPGFELSGREREALVQGITEPKERFKSQQMFKDQANACVPMRPRYYP